VHSCLASRVAKLASQLKPTSPGGAILMFEPSGTFTTGDRHTGTVPDYIDRTAGHEPG
jgi:hypothetical protein